MIPNQWYAVLESGALPADKPVGIRRLGERMVLWRDGDGRAVCMEDRCAHRGVALSIGKVSHGTLRCAYHGLRYNEEGQCVHVPCNASNAPVPKTLKVRSYPVREANGYVFVWWGEERETYPEIPWVEDIPAPAAERVTRSEIWPFNYSRLVENNLDAHHWAFLHGSVMVGVGEQVSDWKVTATEDSVLAEGTLQRAAAPKRAGWAFRLAFRAPNINMIRVTPRFRSIIFTTPVDEFTSWVSISSYQTYTRAPVLRWMLDQYCIKFLFAVPQYRQDFPVFHEQRPHRSGIGVSKLLKADQAIGEYLKIRERLIKNALPEGDHAAVFDRALGTWNPSLTGQATRPRRALPMLEEDDRNATIGKERTVGLTLAWLVNLLSFPLLLPSLIMSTVLDYLDGVSLNAKPKLGPKLGPKS